jgi:aminomethyltransferase
MAINFFFNTCIDDHGVMYGRAMVTAGDYVLLVCLTDIACVQRMP